MAVFLGWVVDRHSTTGRPKSGKQIQPKHEKNSWQQTRKKFNALGVYDFFRGNLFGMNENQSFFNKQYSYIHQESKTLFKNLREYLYTNFLQRVSLSRKGWL